MRVRPPTEPVAGQPRPTARKPRDPGRNWLDRLVQYATVVLVGAAIITAAGTPQTAAPACTPTISHQPREATP